MDGSPQKVVLRKLYEKERFESFITHQPRSMTSLQQKTESDNFLGRPKGSSKTKKTFATIAQQVEHFLGKTNLIKQAILRIAFKLIWLSR